MNVDDGIYCIGIAVITYYTTKLIWWLLCLVTGFFIGPAVDLRTFGGYACVTGGTDGIGKAYAFELAARGLNLVIISRSQDKLSDLADSIRRKHNVDVKIIVADFTKADIYSSLALKLAEIDIGVLVNNVGMVGADVECPQYYFEYDVERIPETLNCNVLSVMMMTRIVLPMFVKKSKGLVINISSISAHIPPCLRSVYASTKLTVQVFSSSIQAETSRTSPGIIVQDVAPGYVATKLAKKEATSFHVPSPTNFVHSAINTIGHLNNTSGCISHEIELLLMSILPRLLLTRLVIFHQKHRRSSFLNKAK